jgi:hypothetical protein
MIAPPPSAHFRESAPPCQPGNVNQRQTASRAIAATTAARRYLGLLCTLGPRARPTRRGSVVGAPAGLGCRAPRVLRAVCTVPRGGASVALPLVFGIVTDVYQTRKRAVGTVAFWDKAIRVSGRVTLRSNQPRRSDRADKVHPVARPRPAAQHTSRRVQPGRPSLARWPSPCTQTRGGSP